jgi:transposase
LRADVVAARQQWQQDRSQWKAHQLIFLDETGLNTKMTRLRGRAPRGQRCLAHAPHGHWKTATFIAALRHDRLSAPWLLDGPMDGDLFLTYIREVLLPEIQPGDLVICDNLSSHKVQGVAAAIESRQARLLYLPAYSPDLNPIEMAFAKLKAALRQSAQTTFRGLSNALKKALASFSSSHCQNFFRHAQYASD